MFYTKESKYYDPNRGVIKLVLDVNRVHYPDFPSVLYVSEFYYESAIIKLMGLDYDIKKRLNLSDDEYGKTWIAFGVTASHTHEKKFFGINGDTMHYRWR